jgi:hypothetical protein
MMVDLKTFFKKYMMNNIMINLNKKKLIINIDLLMIWLHK